jgi:type I restriction enzyme S subunit
MDGDFNCARWRGPKGLLNQRVCRVILKSDIYHQKLLDYALPGYLKAINDMTSSVTVKHLSSKSIAEIPLPLPPMDQQKRIVAEIEKQFSRLDEAVANLKRVKANLKRYKAAVLKASVEGRLVETEAELAHREGRSYETGAQLLQRILETRRSQWKGNGKYKEPAVPDTADLPELPEGWVWALLDSLIVDGPQNGLYLPKSLYGSGHPILRIDDYQQDWIRPVAELQRVRAKAEDVGTYSLRSGDLVINRVNSPSHLGKVAVWTPSAEMPMFESNMMRAALSSAVVPLYIATYLRSVDGRARLTKQAKWAVNQASINQQDVCGTPVPLPPLSEQNRIVEEVDRRISLIRETEAQFAANMTRAERLRQSILGRAFTGELYNLRPASSTREASANEVKSNVFAGTH